MDSSVKVPSSVKQFTNPASLLAVAASATPTMSFSMLLDRGRHNCSIDGKNWDCREPSAYQITLPMN
jgi:hypothetical protein